MAWLDFSSNALWLNGALFALAAAVVWFAGTRIAIYADLLSERLGLGKAFVGLFFLALATETPEIGATVTASLRGNAALTLNNIFGGVVMQTAILAVVDLALVRGALTFFSPRPILLLQGLLLTLLLGLTLAAFAIGESVGLFGVDLLSLLLLGAYLLTLYLAHAYEGQARWKALSKEGEKEAIEARKAEVSEAEQEVEQAYRAWSTTRLILYFLGGALLIFGAGSLLARVAEALAEQSGLGSSFVGASLLAASTSLPELSTTIMAIRLNNYSMAISNIFGSNSIMVALLFIADLSYREGSLLAAAEPSVLLSAALGIVVTTIYLVGLVERKDKTFLRMGYDSALVLGLYLVSLGALYLLR